MRFLKNTRPASSVALIALTFAAGAAFKVSGFAREVFIAAKFGLSAVTDAYFGLQQFPLTLATFMFGAFALAFAPAYAEARRRSRDVEWLPGLLLYGSLIALGLMALMLALAPFLLRMIHIAGTSEVRSTLAILAGCFLPIVSIGIWAGICTARGRVLWSMSITGLPYLVATLALFGLYAAGRLNNLSLPLSMTVGFGLIGIYSAGCILRSQPLPKIGSLLSLWGVPQFRSFLRQLAASSLENIGFAGNQLLMLFFISRAGTGVLSANNCAMRIGMLGFSLLTQPLAQLVHSRLCSTEGGERSATFRSWMAIVAGAVVASALALYVLRVPVIRIVYMHGRFQGAELNAVIGILPAWIGYFVVMSLNAIVARYLFVQMKGRIYVRHQLCAYGVANLLRFALAGSLGASWIIWCSVLAEAAAFALNVYACAGESAARFSPATEAASS
jgi:putative peptidoglycan lipid II flippase